MKKNAIEVPVSLNVTTTQADGSAAASAKGQSSMIFASEQYANLDISERAMWNLANNHVQSPADLLNNTKRGTNGWTLYYTCSMALSDAEMSPLRVPTAVAIPQNLPLVSVVVSYLNNTTPVINIVPDDAYAAGPTIVVCATPVVALGNGSKKKFTAKAYRKIGTITGGIPLAGVDVASQYLSVFPSLPKSCKIGLRLMAVNPGGYRSQETFTVALTPQVTLAALAPSADDDVQLDIQGSRQG